jgi:hypothetical protein
MSENMSKSCIPIPISLDLQFKLQNSVCQCKYKKKRTRDLELILNFVKIQNLQNTLYDKLQTRNPKVIDYCCPTECCDEC